MNRWIVASVFAVLTATNAYPQGIIVDTEVSLMEGGSALAILMDVDSSALAVKYNGQPANIILSGNHTLFERQNQESYFDTIMNYSPWWEPDGDWSGHMDQIHGNLDSCYTSAVVAQTAVTKVTVYSDKKCTDDYRTREPHGYSICPLILDLNGDGIGTTGVEAPVAFMDVDADGINDPIGWTNPASEEAFLWLDLNGSGSVDVGELFGTAMPMPSGSIAGNGYEALASYDNAMYGGNGDGAIDANDLVWKKLLLWVDRDHSGTSHPPEIRTLEAERIPQLSLTHQKVHVFDGHENILMLVGSYKKYASSRHEPVTRRMADVLFLTVDN